MGRCTHGQLQSDAAAWLLYTRPAGWRGSSGSSLPLAKLVSFLDAEAPADIASELRVLCDEIAERGWPAAVEGMLRSLAAIGGVNRTPMALSAVMAAAWDGRVEYEKEIDLGVYDGVLRLLEGGGRRVPRRARSLRPPRRPSAPSSGRSSYPATPSTPSWRPSRSSRSRRARRCSNRRSPTATAQGGRGCSNRQGSRCRSRPRVSAGPTSRSRMAGAWGDAPPYVRAWLRGPGFLRPDEQGQDPHSHRDWDCRDVHGLFGEVLADRPAGASAGQGQAGGHTGRAAGRQGQGEVARSRRVRLSALRRGWGKAAVPGDTRESREEERDIHDQRRVQQVGYRLRGRQTRGGNPAASCTTPSGWRWTR